MGRLVSWSVSVLLSGCAIEPLADEEALIASSGGRGDEEARRIYQLGPVAFRRDQVCNGPLREDVVCVFDQGTMEVRLGTAPASGIGPFGIVIGSMVATAAPLDVSRVREFLSPLSGRPFDSCPAYGRFGALICAAAEALETSRESTNLWADSTGPASPDPGDPDDLDSVARSWDYRWQGDGIEEHHANRITLAESFEEVLGSRLPSRVEAKHAKITTTTETASIVRPGAIVTWKRATYYFEFRTKISRGVTIFYARRVVLQDAEASTYRGTVVASRSVTAQEVERAEFDRIVQALMKIGRASG